MGIDLAQRQYLRKTLRKQRLELSPTVREQLSGKAQQNALILPEFQHGKYIAFYSATESEIATTELIEEALARKKHCYLPVLHPNIEQHLEFYTYHKKDPLKKNKLGIDEPAQEEQQTIAAIDLDLVFVPLVGFDRQGHRLGRGAGYYDRTFSFLLNSAQTKPVLVGLAYEFQRVDEIPSTNWDIPLNIIVTEKNIYRPKIK